MIKQRPELTFKHNLERGRHGWLRLTPAYSVQVVQHILREQPSITHVLDPFSGTGTTGLVCAEQGINCDLLDINPFLVWFASVKTARFDRSQLEQAQNVAIEMTQKLSAQPDLPLRWLPPISHIGRWWSQTALAVLSNLHHDIEQYPFTGGEAKNLLLVAFCRLLIETSNAAFNHQSMSFKQSIAHDAHFLLLRFQQFVEDILEAAQTDLTGQINVTCADARSISLHSTQRRYDAVITSPPYPNRMSYIRELRPYMYWLGYLREAREAGELDWQAIGGTWGIATSRVEKWRHSGESVPYPAFDNLIEHIAAKSPLLANYVHKYFVDMAMHFASVRSVLAKGAKLVYIVGNSKFYDTVVPAESIYAHLLEKTGFGSIDVQPLRKRNSKKELYEFIVSAHY